MRQNQDGGVPSPDSDVRGPSGDLSGPPAGIGGRRDDGTRQLRREFEQRVMDAQDLRRILEGNANRVDDVNRVIEALRRAGDYMNYDNPEQFARLKAAIDLTRKVELQLARDLDRLNQADRYFSVEDNEAPADYRKLVEEYYKSLAKSK